MKKLDMNLIKILQKLEVIVTYMFRKVTGQEKNLDLKKVVQGFWGSIQPKAADDAKKVFVFEEDKIPLDELVFDHKKILEDFLK